MTDVCVACVWKIGRAVFTTWLGATLLIANFLFLLIWNRLSFGKAIVANVAMSGAGWLFIAAIPVPLYAYAIVWELLFGDRYGPISWLIPVLLSAVAGALFAITVLAAFRESVNRSTFLILFALNLACVGIAVFRMAIYVSAHPPVA